MQKFAVALFVVGIALPMAAFADDTKEGWGLQFRQDTFDKVLFPIALASEEGDGFDKALVAFACGDDGKLRAFFQPERFMIFSDAAKAEFRDGDTTKEFAFAVGDILHLGKRLIVDATRSAELANIFETAATSDVPFRTKKKQGVFTSIGATEAFKVVQEHCPKPKQ